MTNSPPSSQPTQPLTCPTCSGQARETTHMICMDCGTDYAAQPLRKLTGNGLEVLRASLAEVSRLRAENTALRASLDQFNSFPDNPGPGTWSTSYRMGYADAGRDVRAIARALGLDQDGRGQANG